MTGKSERPAFKEGKVVHEHKMMHDHVESEFGGDGHKHHKHDYKRHADTHKVEQDDVPRKHKM